MCCIMLGLLGWSRWRHDARGVAHEMSPENPAMSCSGRGWPGVPRRPARHTPTKRSLLALISEVLAQNPPDLFQDFFAVHIYDCFV